MAHNLISRNSGVLLLATSILMLITFASCGCLSESDSSGSSALTTTTDAYSQSGGTATWSNKAITASNTDGISIKVTDGGTFTLSDSIITKTGDTSSNENSDFYSLNAAVLAESESTIKLTNCTVSTSANGAN